MSKGSRSIERRRPRVRDRAGQRVADHEPRQDERARPVRRRVDRHRRLIERGGERLQPCRVVRHGEAGRQLEPVARRPGRHRARRQRRVPRQRIPVDADAGVHGQARVHRPGILDERGELAGGLLEQAAAEIRDRSDQLIVLVVQLDVAALGVLPVGDAIEVGAGLDLVRAQPRQRRRVDVGDDLIADRVLAAVVVVVAAPPRRRADEGLVPARRQPQRRTVGAVADLEHHAAVEDVLIADVGEPLVRFRVAGRRQRIERAQAEAPAEADAADDAGMEHVLPGQVDLGPEVVAEALAGAGVLTLRQLLDEELVVLADEAVREPRLAARQRAGHRQARRPVLDAQPLLAHDGREEVGRGVAQPVAADVRRHLDDAAAALAELGRVDAAAHRQRLHGLDADPRIEAAVQRIADVEAVEDEERLALAGAVDVDAAAAVHDHARQRAQRVLDAVRSVERHVHRLGAAERLLAPTAG